MTPDERARMNELCTQIQNERNYHKFEELISEVNALIAAKESRFPQSKLPAAGPAHKILHATATKTLPPVRLGKTETIEIQVADADPLYGEIRVENSFTDDRGNVFALRPPLRLDIELRTPAQAQREPNA